MLNTGLAHKKCYKCEHFLFSCMVHRERRTEDLTEEGGFKEECAKTETFELSLDGGVQIYWGKVVRRPTIKV